MFVSFLYPYKIRNLEAPFLWVFYELLNRFRWRLSGPPEAEIYKKHLDHYRSSKSREKEDYKKKFQKLLNRIRR